MTWAIFYLVCFLIGVTLSVVSFLGGTFHLPHVHVHLPHGHVPHIAGHVAAGHAGQTPDMPFFNFATITAFLAWFGGTGYLLEHYYNVWFVLALGISIVSGIGAAAVVFWFVAKVLMAHEAPLDPADYDMVGVLGKLSMPIRAGGTVEVI